MNVLGYTRKALGLAALATGSLVLIACSGGSPTGPSPTASGPAPGTTAPVPGTSTPAPTPAPPSTPQSITGRYELTTVSDRPVPGVFESFSPGAGVTMQMEAVSGLIVVNDDGTYLHQTYTRLTGTNLKPVERPVETVGTYTYANNTLTLKPLGGSPYIVAYVPGEIEIVTEAPGLNGTPDRLVWAYQKR